MGSQSGSGQVCTQARESSGFPGGPVVENLPASVANARDAGSVPGSGRSSGKGNGNRL